MSAPVRSAQVETDDKVIGRQRTRVADGDCYRNRRAFQRRSVVHGKVPLYYIVKIRFDNIAILRLP
jgi:hypothetical protein